jgi:glyoxylase-like metal-dependent hydrolase (beta-lactamase superfamily II)
LRAREITPGIFRVDRTWGSNVYLVAGRPTTVIDGGFPMDTRKVVACLRVFDGGIPPRGIATHYHIDHNGSFSELKRLFALRLAAQEADAAVIEGSERYDNYMVDRLRTVYYGALKPLFRYRNTVVDERLEDGDVLDVLGGLQVLVIPGHTAGSIVLFQEARGILFSGDVIRNEKGVLDGPPPQFSPGIEESYFEIRRRILELDFGTLLPGHGEPVLRGAKESVVLMMRRQGRLG